MAINFQENNWLKFKLPIVCISLLCSNMFMFIGIPISLWHVWKINKKGKTKKSKRKILFSKKLALNYLLVGLGFIFNSTILMLLWTGYLIYLLFLVDETFETKKANKEVGDT